jgi:site-specific DNA-methyltransferase (adenine-specific)
MNRIPDKSIDMILCDLPYGTTSSKWDNIIPFEPLWEQYNRVIKENGAIVLFSSQPFTTDLINSNRSMFRQELIWYKNIKTGSALAKKRPLKQHENIIVFYKKQPTYNPQMEMRTEDELKRLSKNSECKSNKNNVIGDLNNKIQKRENMLYKYPTTILQFNGVFNRSGEKTDHPNQKPIELLKWLISTYSNEGELILDNCMGSGSTAIACMETKRNYIGFETDLTYYNITEKRIHSKIKSLKNIS